MKKIFVLIIFSVTFSFSQDYNLTGAGARAEGFSGAYIGLADDATAVVWNPAGLTQLEKPEASVVTRLVGENTAFKYTLDPSLNNEESQGHFGLNFGSFVLPISSGDTKIVIAAAFQRQIDFYDHRVDKRDVTIGLFDYTRVNTDDSKGGINTITPAIAMRFSPVFSVGISANIWTGNLDSKSTLEVITIGRDMTRLNEDFSGFNLVIGGLVDFEGMKNAIPLKIGFTLRTPFTLTGEGYFEDNQELLRVRNDTYDVKQTIDMPLMFGLGASYRVGDNLTFAMDYEIRNYGSKKMNTDVTDKTTRVTGHDTSDISSSKKGLNELRIGAEYLIVTDLAVIPLRLGFKTVPTVLSDYVYNNSSGNYDPSTNQVTGSGFSFGSGFIAETFAFDITYSISSYTQKYDVDGQIEYSKGTLSSSIIFYF